MVEGRCRSGRSCCCSRWMSVACEEGEGFPSRTGCWEATWRRRLGRESTGCQGPGEDLRKVVRRPSSTWWWAGTACSATEVKRRAMTTTRFSFSGGRASLLGQRGGGPRLPRPPPQATAPEWSGTRRRRTRRTWRRLTGVLLAAVATCATPPRSSGSQRRPLVGWAPGQGYIEGVDFKLYCLCCKATYLLRCCHHVRPMIKRGSVAVSIIDVP